MLEIHLLLLLLTLTKIFTNFSLQYLLLFQIILLNDTHKYNYIATDVKYIYVHTSYVTINELKMMVDNQTLSL